MAECWPAFADLVRQKRWSAVPPPFPSLLGRLQNLARLPGSYEDTVPGTRSDLPDDGHYTYMRHHRVCCLANAFKADSARSVTARATNASAGIRRSLPGLLVLLSSRHLLGFSIMRRYEGPSTAFDVYVYRFPEAPGMVCPDSVQDRPSPSTWARGVSRRVQLGFVAGQQPRARRLDAFARHELPGV